MNHGYQGSSVWAVAYSPNGFYTASVDNSLPAEIILWNSANGKILQKFKTGISGGDKLSISNNSKFIAYGNNNKVKIWNVKRDKLVNTLRWHGNTNKHNNDKYVSGISFSPNNKYILASSINGNVRAWDIISGKCLGIYHNPVISRTHVYSAIFDDKRDVIIAGYAHYILCWDALRNKIIYKLTDDSLVMEGVTNLYKLNSDTLLSIDHDESKDNCRIWDIRSGNVIKRFQIDFCGTAISISPDKKYIASSYCGDKIPSLKIRELPTGKLIHTILTNYIIILSIAWSPDGRQIFTGSTDGTLTMWNVPKE